MDTMDESAKKNFMAARYMDDILMCYVRSKKFDSDKFLDHFKHACYWSPLKLTEGTQGVFLETTFELNNNKIRTRLKNDNERSIKIWRYHHYYSQIDYKIKRATLLAALRKVHHMASDKQQLTLSALAKLREFAEL